MRPELPPPRWGSLPLPPDIQRHWLEDVTCPMKKLNKPGGVESTEPLQELITNLRCATYCLLT